MIISGTKSMNCSVVRLKRNDHHGRLFEVLREFTIVPVGSN
jgi:hypothetical protein